LELFKRGDQLWVEMFDVDRLLGNLRRYIDQKTAPRIERQVLLVTGSHHKQIFWYATGSGTRLGMLPWSYLIEAKRWVPRSATFLRPEKRQEFPESGRWNTTCLRCHTTGPRPRYTRSSAPKPQSDVVEHGIACEACHGPAARHRANHANPLRRYASYLGLGAGDDVVNPTDLDASRGSQVCAYCHSAFVFRADKDLHAFVKFGPQFRPGDRLKDRYHVIRHGDAADGTAMTRLKRLNPGLLDKLFWSDGMIKTGGREYTASVESKCHTDGEGDRQLSCMSCHQLHKKRDDPRPNKEWMDDQVGAGMKGDAACTGCHPKPSYRTDSHTHHAADSAGSRCMNCHMPHATYTLLKATRDHLIQSPSAAVASRTGRPSACNLCHLDKSLGWTSRRLGAWYGKPIPPLTADEDNLPIGVRWGLAGDALQRALVVWHMGWEPARKASGADWMPLVLLQRLTDPYPAVRFMAKRVLKLHSTIDVAEYDWIGRTSERMKVAARAFRGWVQHHNRAMPPAPGQVIGEPMPVKRADFDRLLSDRDDKKVDLPE